MASYICPHCLEEHKRDDVAFKCENRAGIRHSSLYFLAPKRLYKSKPKSEICPECRQKSIQMCCPSCKKELENIDNVFFISLAGARSSGKTVFTYMAVKALAKFMKEEGFSVVEPPSTTSALNLIKVENNYILPGTTSTDSREPLILNFIKGKTEFSVVFIDAAGEVFNKATNFKNRSHIHLSDILLFLVDPRQIPELRRRLGLADTGATQIDRVIRDISDEFRTKTGTKKGKIKVPLYCCISLIDELIPLYEDVNLPLFMEESYYSIDHCVYDKHISATNESVKRELKDWNCWNFFNTLSDSFKDVTYFGLSSLGNRPDASNRAVQIAPINLLDPILVFLARKGLIKMEKIRKGNR